MKGILGILIAVIFAVLCGGLTFWTVASRESREIKMLEETALCVVELPAETSSVTATFKTPRRLDNFEIGVRLNEFGGPFSIAIYGDGALVGKVTFSKIRKKVMRFGLGRDIPAGIYTVEVDQGDDSHGGRCVIAGKKPVYVTGWQIISHIYAGSLLLTGLWALINRKSTNPKRRASSAFLFQMFLLVFLAVFFYLLFHEGGHALAETAFGAFDLSRSDFWGIHGHPHSGRAVGVDVEPWQAVIITSAGPYFPTIMGIVLFTVWRSPPVRRSRGRHSLVNLYSSAIIGTIVLPSAILGVPTLLRITTGDESDLIYLVANLNGPVWLAVTLLTVSFALSFIVLWFVVPEIVKTARSQYRIALFPAEPR